MGVIKCSSMAMMRMRFAFLLVLATLPPLACAQTWTFEGFLGDAYNLSSRLKIEQDGGYAKTLSADYRTRGFAPPFYYVLRAARWHEGRAWEGALIHHKLYLANPPDGVADLSISHGFNIVSLNRAVRAAHWVYRFGGGLVITHAEATINGVRYDGPYRLSGAALLVGGGWRFDFSRSFFASAELMATAAYASAKLSGPPDGRIETSNVAIHALAGIGYELR